MTTSDTTLPQAMLDLQSDQVLLTQAKAVFTRLMPNMDMSEQNFPHHMLTPFCLAVAQLYVDLEDVERRTSLATATGDDLDNLGNLYGVARTGSTKARGVLRFSGTNGSIIVQGYTVTTADPNPITFQVLSGATIAGGIADVNAEALESGAEANVALGTITRLTSPVPTGITAVTNQAAFIGGEDQQEDGDTNQFVAGYRADIHDLSAARGEGGAAKHIRKWVRQVAGVGAVRVIEGTPSPGWVQITIVGDNKLPASDAVVLAVEDFLLDPWRVVSEAESMALTGFGMALATDGTNGTPAGGTNNVVQGSYNASGNGVITLDGLEALLPQPGIWRIRLRLRRTGAAGTGNLVTFGMWDETAADWARTRPNGSVAGVLTLTGAQLATTYAWYEVDGAWLGVNPIQFRLNRLTSDTSTQIAVDEIQFWATMSRDDRDVGLVPSQMRLQVQSATSSTINVAADVTYGLSGAQTISSVNADLHTRLVEYFADKALQDDNDARRAQIEDIIFTTPGISDVATVTLNGVAANVVIGPTQVAVLGTETWT
jgi:uncharacterized phage protein gp47/JayE